MAFDSFIKFDRIEGESTDKDHNGWIELLDGGMHIRQPVGLSSSASQGMTTGRADFGDFCFTKNLDKATPALALAAAKGTHFSEVTVELCRAGDEKVKFMEYKFKNVVISSIDMNNSGDFPTESVSLFYTTVKWSYAQQNRQGGGLKGHVAAGWDRQKNCKI
jgi:type VI secretion system secreted protein Hcp